ncbi:MAG: acyltransferase [Acidobacteriota bacterium]|nr:acyltransferase [Acidobacteriota bacterium]
MLLLQKTDVSRNLAVGGPEGRNCPSQSRDGLSANLDFLRAVAVSCVFADYVIGTVLNLQSAILSALGRIGVLIFFVHTALVLMGSLSRERRFTGWIARFYLRRIFRLYPLSLLFILIALAYKIPRGPRGVFEIHSATVILSNVFLCQNFVQDHSIVGPMWSLPYEVQMYVLLPFIFLALSRAGRQCIALIVLTVAALALARLNYTWPPDCPVFTFFPCFMGGVLMYQLKKYFAPKLHAWTWPIFVVGTLIYILLELRSPDLRHQWLVCIVFGLAIPHCNELRSRSVVVPSGQLAKYSYGVYLSHDTLLWLFFVKLHVTLCLAWSCFALTATFLPIVLFHLIENPMLKLGGRLTSVDRAGKKTIRRYGNNSPVKATFRGQSYSSPLLSGSEAAVATEG